MMKRMVMAMLTLGCVFALGAVKKEPKTPGVLSPPPSSEDKVLLVTPEGNVVLQLFGATAPRTVEHFVKLVKAGVYDHTAITFIDPDYYIQVGTPNDRTYPLTKEQSELIVPVPFEEGQLKHLKGALSMSRTDGDPNSDASAFAVMMGEAHHLDGKNTVFGQVDSGMDVLEKIQTSATDAEHRPTKRIEILRAEILSPLAAAAAERGMAARMESMQLKFAMQALLAIVLVTLASFFLRMKLPPKIHQALNLLVTFIAAFTLFMLFTPMARQAPLVGGAIFMGMVGFYKLMNRFESA